MCREKSAVAAAADFNAIGMTPRYCLYTFPDISQIASSSHTFSRLTPDRSRKNQKSGGRRSSERKRMHTALDRHLGSNAHCTFQKSRHYKTC